MKRNDALRELADAAREAVEHVAMANYAHREAEAQQMIADALARLLRPEPAA